MVNVMGYFKNNDKIIYLIIVIRYWVYFGDFRVCVIDYFRLLSWFRGYVFILVFFIILVRVVIVFIKWIIKVLKLINFYMV